MNESLDQILTWIKTGTGPGYPALVILLLITIATLIRNCGKKDKVETGKINWIIGPVSEKKKEKEEK